MGTGLGLRRTKPRHQWLGAQFARGFGAMVLLLTVVALYLDLSSAVDGSRKPEHLVVTARRTGGLVVFEAYRNDWPFRWRVMPGEIAALRVIDWVEGTPLWEIEASRPRRVAVIYGEVPTGFTQTIPKAGVPSPLRPGASYGVSVRGHGGSGALATFNTLIGIPG